MDEHDNSSARLCSLPVELLEMIIDFTVHTPVGDGSRHPLQTLLAVDRTIRKTAIHYLSSFQVSIHAKSGSHLPHCLGHVRIPKPILRSVKDVRISFTGMTYEEMVSTQPFIEKLASLWKEGNHLERVMIVAPPAAAGLYVTPPRLMKNHQVEAALHPLVSLLGNGIMDWSTFDLGGPYDYSNESLLECMAVKRDCERIITCIMEQPCPRLNVLHFPPGRTVLQLAVLFSLPGNVAALLQHPQIDVNVRDSIGQTALMLATRLEDQQCVYLLLTHKHTDPDLGDDFGVTPLRCAELKQNIIIYKQIMAASETRRSRMGRAEERITDLHLLKTNTGSRTFQYD